MRALLVAVMVIVPAVATAKPALITTVEVQLEAPADAAPADAYAVTRAITAAAEPALGSCWRKAGRARIRVVVDGAVVTKVEVVERGDRRATRCATKRLAGLAVPDAAQPAVAVLAITSATAEDRNRSIIRALESMSDDPTCCDTLGTRGVGAGDTGGLGTLDTGPLDGPDHARTDAADVGGTGAPHRLEARVAVGAVETADLSADAVKRVVLARIRGYRACYRRELATDPGLAGKLVVDVAVGANGKATGAKVRAAASTLASAGLAACMETQASRLVFPKPSAATTIAAAFYFNAE